MRLGLPYDSDGGRAFAAAVTSIICGQAYRTSAEIAASKGPFAGYAKNEEPRGFPFTDELRVLLKIQAGKPMIYCKIVAS